MHTTKQNVKSDKVDLNGQVKKSRLKNHRLSLTCACIDSKDEFVFTASKDGSIIKWSMKSHKIIARVDSLTKSQSKEGENSTQKHHLRHINCIAISSDDQFLASGGWDKMIRIWSPKDLSWIHTFSMHRQEVTCLAFRLNNNTLYSGSADRSVMLWTLEDDDNRCFVESLYGHESTVTSLDPLKRERLLSSGGLDRSIRIWKIVEQAQSVIESNHDSADIVKSIDDKIFVSGGTDGSLILWTTMKRSPLFTLPNAHKLNKSFTDLHQTSESLRYDQKNFSFWISALATYSSTKIVTTNPKKKRKREDSDDDNDVNDDNDNDAESSDSNHSGDEDGDIPDLPEAVTVFIASGSCNSEVKIWKLVRKDGKYQMQLHQLIECHGFVNDLSFSHDGRKLVAVCGQEHKFGRWWKLKKAKNCLQILDVNK